MTMSSIGDLAYHLMLRSRSTMLSRDLTAMTQELASGQVANVTEHLNGDVSYLLDINRDLTRLDGFEMAAAKADGTAEAMQTSLGLIQSAGEDLATTLVNLSNGASGPAGPAATAVAYGALETVLSALNTTFAGQSLFAGTATDRAPMGTATSLMDALTAEVAASSTGDQLRTSVENWFSDPNGFESLLYFGSEQSRNPVQIGAREQVSLSLRADDTIFRDLLVELSVLALAGQDELDIASTVQMTLQDQAIGSLFNQIDGLTDLRSEIGYAQARIDETATRNAAARSSLEMARTTLVEADPYDTALRLEEVQFQLEGLYTVTSRNARLSLLSYLE